jgi:hypothetical protein
MFDRQQKLFKSLTYTWRGSEDYKEWSEINHGVQATGVQGVVAVDYDNQRATIFPVFGGGFPDVDVNHVDKLFDITNQSIRRVVFFPVTFSRIQAWFVRLVRCARNRGQLMLQRLYEPQTALGGSAVRYLNP